MNMKKFLSATLIAMLIGFTAKAQLEVKPTVGINLSNVRSAPDGTTTSAKLGYQIGGSLMFGTRIYLSPGIYYYQQTTQYVMQNPGGGSTAITSDEKIAGVKIPLLVGLKVINPENDPLINLRLFAGPSLLFNTKNTFSGGIPNDQINWKKSSWGAQIGAGLDVSFLFLEAGYEFGLSNTFDSNSAAGNFSDTKHNTFILNAGVRFKL